RTGHHGRQAQVHAYGLSQQRQGKVQPEQLHQQRGAPEYLDKEYRDALGDPVMGKFADAEGKSEKGAEYGRIDGKLYGYPGALQQRGAVAEPFHSKPTLYSAQSCSVVLLNDSLASASLKP